MGIKKQNKKTNQMRFYTLATAALCATTQALGVENNFWIESPAQSNLLMSKIAAEHIFDLEEMMEAVDTNGDGAVSWKEVKQAIAHYAREHGYKMTKADWKEVHKVFKHLDANGDKKVTIDEVKTAIWQAVDGNNDGVWSLEEVQDAIEAVAHELDVELKASWKDEIAEGFKHVDTDNSGGVDPKELEAAIKKYGYPDLSQLAA